MNRIRAFLDRLLGGHRPPRGPLTTVEQGDADKLQQETLEEEQRVERERDEKDSSSGRD